MDVLTPYFLSITAHLCILFCVLWDKVNRECFKNLKTCLKDNYTEASLPSPPFDKERFADLDGSLLLCLIIGITLLVTEITFLFRQVLSPRLAIFCLLCHTSACLLLLKFIIDLHTVQHFWIVFILFSVPPTLIQLYLFGSSFNKGSCF